MSKAHIFTAKDGGILCEVEQVDDTVRISCNWERVTVRQTTEHGEHGDYPVVIVEPGNRTGFPKSLEQIVAEIAEMLCESDGETIAQMYNDIVATNGGASEIKYSGDSLFEEA